jgi:predicted RNase H-like nuclease (RuvC/YqgF family)
MLDPLDDSASPVPPIPPTDTNLTPDAQPVSRNVVQWLNEVKSLQQQIADLNVELIAATETTTAWRSRYETEGQQRRAEVMAAQQKIAKLEAEIRELRTQPQLDTNLGDSAIALQIEGMLNMNELKAKLFEVWLDRDRALEAIKSEQLAHDQTRNDLTMALADVMDVLKPNNPS